MSSKTSQGSWDLKGQTWRDIKDAEKYEKHKREDKTCGLLSDTGDSDRDDRLSCLEQSKKHNL